jgi:DNA-directed RNA polymerase specialized sigma24 family protein
MADLVPIPSGDDDGAGAGLAEHSESELRRISPPTFAELVEAWHGPVYCFAACLTGDQAEAVRLTQQAFRSWIERGGRSGSHGKERHWLFAALYQEFANAEIAAPSLSSLDRAHPVSNPSPVESTERILRRRPEEIVAALQRVRIAARVPLAFMYAGNFTVSEIAEVLGLAVDEVMEQLASGKAQLTAALVGADEVAAPQPAAAG